MESPRPPQTVEVVVHTVGWLSCNSYTFYGCSGVLSILPADVPLDFTRPPSEALRWVPDDRVERNPTDRILVGTVPSVVVGRHQLVVTLMGSSDVVSIAPDGSVGFDLLGRCSIDANLPAGADAVDVVVTFVRDQTGMSRDATCSIDVTAS